MTNIKSRDDVLTLLVHLGYLAYDEQTQEIYIPNQEIMDEFESAVEDGGWDDIAAMLKESEALLERKGIEPVRSKKYGFAFEGKEVLIGEMVRE